MTTHIDIGLARYSDWAFTGSVVVLVLALMLLAVELAVQLTANQGAAFAHILATVFFVISFVFVYRSFYGMRIVKAKA